MPKKTTREESMRILGFYPPEEKTRRMWTDKDGNTLYAMTPERAQFILDCFNLENREISDTQVKNIEDSCDEHGWIDDGDVLRFKKNGNIPEWQHRLKVIAKGNKTVYLEIRFGVKNDAATKTANAKARSPYDRIKQEDKTATKNEVATCKIMTSFRIKGQRGGVKMNWNTALDIWPVWKKYVKAGEKIVSDSEFFEKKTDWEIYRRAFAAFSSLCSFHNKSKTATLLIKMLLKYLLNGEGTALARTFFKLAYDNSVLTMSNTRRPEFIYQLLCIASDRLEKDNSGETLMNVNINQVNHDYLKIKGNYYLFLEMSKGATKEVTYKSNSMKQAIEGVEARV